ncbi:Neutral ceramidase [Eumeta japonica]|uniref:Neutral ceramidase n=1 Tax=Eumeta variegata TaxID=151549 RepID=A0A4C1YTS9_EUMVA|nr:Neutral ceramidase [Eumeta japonica]
MLIKALVALVAVLLVAGVTTTLVLVLRDTDVSDDGGDSSAELGSTTERLEESGEEIGADLPYRVGIAMADMTGPCVEINFMGYAEFGQAGGGIHLRQWARAFVFADQRSGAHFAYVVADVQAVGVAVRRGVVERLQQRFGNIYSLRNVIVVGTHTHSAPGGHLVDFILDISILGFSQETYDAYVNGIAESITKAHDAMAPARLFYGETQVEGAHINRSPYSYLYNPAEERSRSVTVDGSERRHAPAPSVRVERADGSLAGVLNWFAVHTTSMNMTNTLISTDNLGYAAIAMEKTLNPGSLVGQGEVVAAFAPASLGDVSPNTAGARCEFSGYECDNHFVLCELLERCYAGGPSDDMFESTKIIGSMIYEGAMRALSAPGEELTGRLAALHQFVDVPQQRVPRYDPLQRDFLADEPVEGCVPALGYSFASGTIDGANVLNITQGTVTGNPLLDNITNIVGAPTAEDEACHAPKPILLATGRSTFPLEWHPTVVSASVVWLGGVAVAGVPGEPTTMAGRRAKDVLRAVLTRRDLPPRAVVAGLTNEYIHYVTTYEEYQVQRYEAASTIYGPHTLDIFLNKFAELLEAALDTWRPVPLDNRGRTVSLILPVVFDASPLGRNFGDALDQPPAVVQRGASVNALFVAANPRNDLRQGLSHAVVERLLDGNWVVVATDADWETRFEWSRTFTLTGTSRVTFSWNIPEDAPAGVYRMRYNGAARGILGNINPFEGTTDNFTIA